MLNKFYHDKHPLEINLKVRVPKKGLSQQITEKRQNNS